MNMENKIDVDILDFIADYALVKTALRPKIAAILAKDQTPYDHKAEIEEAIIETMEEETGGGVSYYFIEEQIKFWAEWIFDHNRETKK